AANQALFAVMGTAYGGDGRTNFGMPDLRGRTPVGAGQPSGLIPVRQGQKRGVETVTLQQSQMPSHTHSLNALPVDATGNVEPGAWLANTRIPALRETTTPAATYASSGSATMLNSGSIGTSGGSRAIDNLPPQLGMRYCIVTNGLFPSRN
ncbi:MAG: tail fiber protein, partial [Gammaproteobacteria bacterium]|nr:tail fiber protein [Gammaproteobacteria bacterium]